MQTLYAISDANRCADKAHPAVIADRRSNLHVDGKTAPVLDRISAKALHLCAGFLDVARNRFFAADLCASRHSKDVIDSARPGKRVVNEVALPASGMVDVERADPRRFNEIGNRAVQDIAEFKMPGLLPKRPRVRESDGLLERQRCTFKFPSVLSSHHENSVGARS